MNININDLNIIRIFVLLSFYVVISYAIVAWKYRVFSKVSTTLRPFLVFTHVFIATSNIIAFLLFILLDRHTPISIIVSLAGLAIAATGALLLIWAILTLKTATFIQPTDGELITIGPYRITAHPMYLGGVIAGFGLAIWGVSLLGLTYTLVIALALIIISREEEKNLVERFGDAYLRYKRGTLLGMVYARLVDW